MKKHEQISWGYRPFIPAQTALYGGMHQGFDLHIVRLSVGDKEVELEWLPCECAAQYRVAIARRGESVGFANNAPKGLPEPQILPAEKTECQFTGLLNGIDYEATVFALDKDGKQIARSFNRLFRAGKFAGKVINYIHPDDYSYGFSGRAVANPSVLRLPAGGLLASHQIVGDQGESNLTLLFRSDDEGNSWHYVSDICPCSCGKLFWFNDSVYLMGLDERHGRWLIGNSRDYGETWSHPEVIMPAGDLRMFTLSGLGKSFLESGILELNEEAKKYAEGRMCMLPGDSEEGYRCLFIPWDERRPWSREKMILYKSEDGLCWQQERELLTCGGEGWEEEDWKTGLNQPAGIRMEKEIYVVTAAAMNGAWNGKTANAMIFNWFPMV